MSVTAIETTGALVGDTPELLDPLSTTFKDIRDTIAKEIAEDPAPDVSCEQITNTTQWLRSIITAMSEHNAGFSRLGISQLGDDQLQRNQAVAREASRQLTLLLAESTKTFRDKPMKAVVEFSKSGASDEIRQNLETFHEFWDTFGDAKWLSGLVAPEFAQNKALAKKLLEALQRKSKPVKAEKGAPGASPGRCNACGYNKMQKGAFCGSCGRCVHGYTTEQCRSGCRPIIQYTPYFHTQWMLQTGMTDCSNTSCGRGVHDHRRQSGCIVGGAAEDTTPAIKAKNVTFYNNIKVPKGSLQKGVSTAKLLRLAQMADLLAQACRQDAEAMEMGKRERERKMDLLKEFAETINEVPKVLRQFLLIRSASIKDDLGQLKEWLHKDEVDAAHMQLEEFRDEAAEERVMRRLGNRRSTSEGSWSIMSAN